MNRGLLLVLLLAAVVGGLFAAGVLPPKSGDVPEDDPVRRGGTPASPGGAALQGLPGAPAREIPKEEPPPQRLRLERPLRTLFLVQRVTSWPMFLRNALCEDSLHRVTSWSADPVGAEAAMTCGGEAPVVDVPTAAWFAEQAFDVLVVAGLDPARIEDAFWEAVLARVKARTLGLLVIPGPPPANRGESSAPPVHPMLLHPLFARLLPVAEGQRIEGASPPGWFGTEPPFSVTPAGAQHPASRIVAFPEWSQRVWQAGAARTPPWGSKFVYPVAALKPGAQVLVQALPAKGKPLPVYVLGDDAAGRVLWFGAGDFGELTYRDPGSADKWTALLHNTVIFLAGRAELPDEPLPAPGSDPK